ncbi:MAG: phosphoenolpyruvate carboxykinase (GTP) [Candidatus Lokiarchaeota archaeon]|nr:phosphoenolpyruvate carboxykinase (GTP) [Candidatus Lokiarchaeota archaeon]
MSMLNEKNLAKLKALNNKRVIEIVKEYIDLLKPSNVYIITDEQKDINFIREMAIEKGEETKLKMEGHTVHYDSYYDQARDKGNTRILITKDQKMSKRLNTKEREEGLKEILGFMDGAMKGKDMIVRFFSLGPKNSIFSKPAMQITDSYYVAHSEDLLYRMGYEEFKKLEGSEDFYLLVHSAGELIDNVTKNIDKRRIYVDLMGNRVLSVNNQYAGNSLGLKKLALRLAIYQANNEDWLTEHMFVMGVHPPNKDRVTYITGAYPSACGKTSTAMIPGQSIVGDDIAYLRIIDNECRAVNIESGVFGIIRNVNAEDDPVIFKTLKTERELIYSNVLINNGIPYWMGMGEEIPKEGRNQSGYKWFLGKTDENGKEITPSHPNARYTVRISDLENADLENLNNPEGVSVKGIFYGGRDSDTNVPIYQSLNWEHGIFIGATIESETTSAILGKAGVRKSSPMANMDFIVVPLAKYFDNHKKFGERLGDNAPLVFATNYFLKIDDEYTNKKVDKKVWVMWAEGRMHHEYDAIETPVGYIPKHEDLDALFQEIFNREYSLDDYIAQFSLRVDKLLEKLERMEKMFKEEKVSQFLFDILYEQRENLENIKKKYGRSVISPLKFV